MGKGDGSLTAINWYLTCSRLSCHLLEVGIYKERADIEVIKSSLLKEQNPIADCYGMGKQAGATDTKEVSKTDVLTPVKIMYINMVMPRQWYKIVLNRTLLFIIFIFTQNSAHNYYNCNFKKQFLHREFLN